MRTFPAAVVTAALALGAVSCAPGETPPIVDPPTDDTTTTSAPTGTTTSSMPTDDTTTTTAAEPTTTTMPGDDTTTTVATDDTTTTTAAEPTTTIPADAGTLRGAAQAAGIEIGTAVAAGPLGSEADYNEVLAREFSSVTAENAMKPDAMQPQRGQFNFSGGDALVAAARENGQVVRGHTLVWHSQNPSWLTPGAFGEEELRQILADHVTAVAGHFQGQIQQWDVVNEVLDGNGNIRTDSVWAPLGESMIADAFRAARAADPEAKLFLNDYSIEAINAKSDGYYAMIQRLLADGVPIDGLGFQTHLTAGQFPSSMRDNLARFADLGLEVALTEVDVRVSTPASQASLELQAETYTDTIEACLAVSSCTSYTVWGFTDRHSWIPDFAPGYGAATPMTEDLQPKPAYDALLGALSAG